MYAVFSTGGKQYRAAIGDIVKVEKLDVEKDATIELDQVLMVGEGEDVNVGSPLVKGGKVTARVVEHGRGDKVKIIKFKRRKHHMKQMGHRQYFTTLEITGIEGAGPGKPKAKKAEAPAEEKAKAPKKEAKPKAEPKAAPVEEAPVEEVAEEVTEAAVETKAEEAAEETAAEQVAEEIVEEAAEEVVEEAAAEEDATDEAPEESADADEAEEEKKED